MIQNVLAFSEYLNFNKQFLKMTTYVHCSCLINFLRTSSQYIFLHITLNPSFLTLVAPQQQQRFSSLIHSVHKVKVIVSFTMQQCQELCCAKFPYFISSTATTILKEIGDEEPCYSTNISIFSFIWAGLAAFHKASSI